MAQAYVQTIWCSTLTAMYVPAKIWRVAAQCNYCNHVLILTELVPRCEGQLSIFNLLKSMAIYRNMSPSPVVGVGVAWGANMCMPNLLMEQYNIYYLMNKCMVP